MIQSGTAWLSNWQNHLPASNSTDEGSVGPLVVHIMKLIYALQVDPFLTG